MCTALYMMVLYDRARVGPTTKTSDEISIICLFRLMLQANPLFYFELWYSSCFEVKCWFHTFPKWCYHTPMWLPILHDNWYCHVNPFQPGCFSSSGSNPCRHPQDHFSVSPTLFSSSVPKLPLFSLPPTPFSSRTRMSYSSISLDIFPTDTWYDMGSIICLFPAYSASQSFVLFWVVVFELLQNQMLIPDLP